MLMNLSISFHVMGVTKRAADFPTPDARRIGGRTWWTCAGVPARATQAAANEGGSPKAHPPGAKAKSVIFLYMSGGPSQLDLLDPKPLLKQLDGKPIPVSVEQRDVYGTGKVMASPYKFAKHGECGAEVSELLPHLSGVVDDIAIVRSRRYQSDRPRRSTADDAHRPTDSRLSHDRKLDHLRVGDGEPESSLLRLDEQHQCVSRTNRDRIGLSTFALPGHADELQRWR